jgi:hypothetical protein
MLSYLSTGIILFYAEKSVEGVEIGDRQGDGLVNVTVIWRLLQINPSALNYVFSYSSTALCWALAAFSIP